MNIKSLILLGTIIASLYIYFITKTYKDELYTEFYPSDKEENIKKIIKEPIKITKKAIDIKKVSTIIEKEYPSFSFLNTKPYSFNMLLNAKSSQGEILKEIKALCEKNSCQNNLQFSKNIKVENWSIPLINLINYMIENKINEGTIKIVENKLQASGTLEDLAVEAGFNNLLLDLHASGLTINNHTTVKSVPKTSVKTGIEIEKEIREIISQDKIVKTKVIKTEIVEIDSIEAEIEAALRGIEISKVIKTKEKK